MAGSGQTRHRRFWLTWLLLTLGAGAWLGYTMLDASDKSLFMPGALSPGHHQLGDACEVCHSDPLGGGEVLQQACVDCHGEERVKPTDSHPRAKFIDPRNADRLEKIDALLCTSCHREHRPEITQKDGLTEPRDMCFYCHENIGEDRPSHLGMGFDSCKDSGCHNFHNNRALYTDFLVKHLHQPALLEQRLLPAREFAARLEEIVEYPRDRYPVQPLGAADMDAPQTVAADASVNADWLASRHAQAGVNCSACHGATDGDAAAPAWDSRPGRQACAQCHDLEIERFGKGKHGMRLAAGLDPMTPADALLPMQADAAHSALTCNACHPAHRYDTRDAAVDACLACHDDRHSLAFRESAHFTLWQQEASGELPQGSGVSCASCHMPRVDHDVNDWMSRVMVDHNQSATLSPNSKMIRPACLHCHGLGFAIDALADVELIARNFQGRPAVQVESMAMAERDLQRAKEEKAQSESE